MEVPLLDLRCIPGIGPARAEALAAAGYHDAWDVLHRAPRLAPPPPPWCEAGPLPGGQAVRLRARVERVRAGFVPGRGRMLEARLERTDGRTLTARFFRAGFLARRLVANEWFVFEGRADARRSDTLNHPAFTHLAGGQHTPGLEPEPLRLTWDLPAGLGGRTWASLLAACLADPELADPAGEVAPEVWRQVLSDLHRPADEAAFTRARRAVARRECLALAWFLAARRASATGVAGSTWRWDDDLHARALAQLPFTLTAGQAAALAEIRADMRRTPKPPMYRLLAGEVGSGKTALALLASLAVIADGAQAAWLAPTAVLADQHFRWLSQRLAGTRVACALLTGGSSASERQAVLSGLAAGALHLVVGTHALLAAEVAFARLGLAVIDEQHRFGTAQRAALVDKSPRAARCDLLLTTATPIPRTLALTAYGDLAITRISGRPPGRQAVRCEVLAFPGWPGLGALLSAEPGRIFVVCPRIAADGSEAEPLDVASAAAAARTALGASQVAVLTGDLAEAQKVAALHAFASGAARCLVATTVIEVGIDVPAATLVVVLGAPRFGLATLHQLRGRVGRGTEPGRCLLLHGAGDAPGLERLNRVAAAEDGLAVAEADLAERGPGELLGLRQAGGFRLLAADLASDLDLLQAAHASVRAGASRPPGLARFTAAAAPGAALLGG